MSVQVVGILLGMFSALISALIFWGAFQEQRRTNGSVTRRIRTTSGG